MLSIGDKAPEFTMKNQNGDEVSLAALRGKTVVLYFYPKDDTPGCTKEACGFRDLTSDFSAVGAEVFGVSPDSVSSHDKFASKYNLPFQLLSDEDKKIVNQYGVWKEKSMYGRKYMGVERTTFVIDREGKIAQIYPKVQVTNHPEAVLETVKSLSE